MLWNVAGPNLAAEDQIVHHAQGIVLDLGPGMGNHVTAFGKAFRQGKVKKIYGFEPNVALHKYLRANLETAGLQGIYEIVGLGVEDIEEFLRGIARKYGENEEGFVDTVNCIHVLCSVPRPEEAVRTLWKVLKKDGQLLVWEHVDCRKRILGRLLQGTHLELIVSL
jgi:SAM-dependent methyltransferase